MSERKSFYLLLDLSVDPPEKNQVKIDEAIGKKNNEWSRAAGGVDTGKKAEALQNQKLLPDIKRIMSDPLLREQEYQAALIQLKQVEKVIYAKLDEMLKVIALKGHVYEEEVEQLKKKFKDISEADIRKRISVPIKKKDAGQTKKEALDPTKANEIRELLKVVGKDNLYDLLGMATARSSSTVTFLQKSDQLYDEYNRKADKDAVVTAFIKLSGMCKTVFKSEEEKSKYDHSLAREKLENLHNDLDAAGLDGEVSAEEFDNVMKKAGKLGLDLDEAKEYILQYCGKKKWPVQVPTKLSVESMQRCMACGLMSGPEAIHCKNCSFPLKIKCPRCKTESASKARSCSKCGFSLGDMPSALNLISQGKIALAQNKISEAEILIKQAEVFWPDHADIQRLLSEIAALKTRESSASQQLQEAVAQRRFYLARQRLSQLRSEFPNHADLSLESSIQEQIRKSEAAVKRAQSTTDADDALDAFALALKEAQDCQVALDGLAKSPPQPPVSLKSSVTLGSIALTWQASPSRGDINYRVIRKEGSRPVNHSDGVCVQESVQTNFDDLKAEPGTIYFYAIYSQRGAVVSHQGIFSDALMRLGEVTDLEIRGLDQTIELKWKMPTRATSVEVWKLAASTSPERGKGTQLSGVRRDGVTDSHLNNGQAYSYRVVVLFSDAQGREQASPGKTCQGSPASPPPAICDLQVQKDGNQLQLRWTPPTVGSVRFFTSSKAIPNIHPGDVWTTAKLAELGASFSGNASGQMSHPFDFQGLLYLLPVTIQGDIAVLGTHQMITSLTEVTNLKGGVNAGKLYLEWDWPSGVGNALIAYRHDRYPTSPQDPDAAVQNQSRNQYNSNRAFVINQVATRPYYFSVYVTAPGPNQELLYSKGVQCLVSYGSNHEVAYEIKLKKNLFGKLQSAELILSSTENEVKLPEMFLLKKTGKTPLNRTDGIKILTISPTTLSRGNVCRITIPATELEQEAYGKLFLTDDSNSAMFRLMASSREQLKLG